jgi:predicted transposase YbfD/YdcC
MSQVRLLSISQLEEATATHFSMESVEHLLLPFPHLGEANCRIMPVE